ncbi:MAG: chain length determinant protein [Thiomicrorhabdus sp.]|nr:MAG: chain length determinant protein [Thiomicrorhabdus sp.]
MNQNDILQNDRNIADDEIDLYELWQGLWQDKLIILVTSVMVVVIAAVYAYSATPVYKASTYLLPPKAEQVQPMNIYFLNRDLEEFSTSTSTFTSKSVFQQFSINMNSKQNLKWAFEKYGLASVYSPQIGTLTGSEYLKAREKAFDVFVNNFSIHTTDKKNPEAGSVAQLSLVLSEEEVANILNALVQRAEKSTINQIYRGVLEDKMSRVNLIEQRIASARQSMHDRRLDRLAQLNEAIKVTKKLNITKPVSAGPTLNINNINATSGQSTQSIYLLGSDLLEAEKLVLEERKNDDAFIPSLRGWQEELQQLKSLNIDLSKFGVVEIDQPAEFAEKIKPRKGLIIAVAGVLGLMLGIFIALIRRSIKKRKEAADLMTTI